MSRLGLDTYLNLDFSRQGNNQNCCLKLSCESSLPFLDENRDVNTYIRHLHQGCEHNYNPDEFDPVLPFKFSDPGQYATDEGGKMVSIIVVFHPRWCRKCLVQRATELRTNVRNRIENYPSPETASNEEEAMRLRCHIAYLAGILGGRTHALSTPLEDNERLDVSDALSEAQDLVSVLNSLSLEHNQPVDVTEEILSRLQSLEVTDDELRYEMEMIVTLWQEEARGFDDGRAIQASAERLALDQADPGLKEQYLQMALG